MRKLFVGLAVALLLGGCAASNTGSSSTVNMVELSKKSAQARVGYLGFLNLANVYMARPRCGAPTSPILCSSQDFIDSTVVPTRVAFGEATKASEAAVVRVGENPSLVIVLVEAAVSSSKAAAVIATKIGGQ